MPAWAALLSVLNGCGGQPASPVQSPPGSPGANLSGLAGNWYFAFADSTKGVDGLLGSLEMQGSALRGVFRVNDPQHSPPCIPATQDVAFSGAVGRV